jgi:hypothetical protein
MRLPYRAAHDRAFPLVAEADGIEPAMGIVLRRSSPTPGDRVAGQPFMHRIDRGSDHGGPGIGQGATISSIHAERDQR